MIGMVLAMVIAIFMMWRQDRRERKGWEILNQMEAKWGSDRRKQ